jgi:replicative DNA helicase
MNITINIIEVASELAEKDLKRAFVECGYEVFPNGIVENQEGIDVYTEEAQEFFNRKYDYWFDFLLDQNIEDEK